METHLYNIHTPIKGFWPHIATFTLRSLIVQLDQQEHGRAGNTFVTLYIANEFPLNLYSFLVVSCIYITL